MEQLRLFFRDVTLSTYENSLEVTQARPIIDYLLSSSGASRMAQFLTPERITIFEDYLQKIIDREKHIKITKESGMFIAKK